MTLLEGQRPLEKWAGKRLDFELRLPSLVRPIATLHPAHKSGNSTEVSEELPAHRDQADQGKHRRQDHEGQEKGTNRGDDRAA